MKSEKIGEDKGELLSVKVLNNSPDLKEVEYSFKAKGNVYGVDFEDLGTTVSSIRPDGSEIGEARGFITTTDGEMLSYRVTGMSLLNGKGFESNFRGVAFYETKNPNSKLARLCKKPILIQYESDENGKSHTTYHEWID